MKTIVHKIAAQLLVIILLVIGAEVKAQYPYNFSFAGIPYDSKTIVRSYDEQHAVVYYEDNGRGYVSLVNVISNNARTVPLDEGVSMNDMCIIDDSVFLCGNESLPNGTFGCIVTMNISSFYTSSVVESYYKPSYWMFMDLKRIKSYKYTYGSNTFKRFLLVGDMSYPCDGSGPFPTNMTIANLLDNQYYCDPNNPLLCKENVVLDLAYPFRYLYIYDNHICFMNTTNHSEEIHDIVVTDSFVVFVGVSTGTYDSITLHICEKRLRILSPPYPQFVNNTFDNYYTYSLSTTSGTPFYHACALDGDKIAIATQEETSPYSDKITIRTFDVSTHTMTHSQVLQCSPSPLLRDIAYIPDLHKVVLLFHDYFRPTSNYSDVFCTADPYVSTTNYIQSGMAEARYNLKYGSLDAMRSTFFVSTGGKFGLVSDVTSLSPSVSCYNLWDYNIFKVDCMNFNSGYYRYDRYSSSSMEWQTVVEPVEMGIPSICIEN